MTSSEIELLKKIFDLLNQGRFNYDRSKDYEAIELLAGLLGVDVPEAPETE